MYRLRAEGIARKEGLGGVIDVIALRPSWVQVAVFWSPAYLVLPILAVRAALGNGFDVVAALVAVIVSGFLWLIVTSERLAVCERGLLLGGFSLFLRPLVVRWDQVDPASLAFVTPYQQVFKAIDPRTGQASGQGSPNRRGPSHGEAALVFTGPPYFVARGGAASQAAPGLADLRVLWSAGIGDARLERTRRALLTAWVPILGPAASGLESRLAAPIVLADDPKAAARQLPGGS